MFTGIITDIGEIIEISAGDDKKVTIATNYPTKKIKPGASICCAGICLTVTELENKSFKALVSGATMSCTNSKFWQVGRKINLEPSLKFGDEVGGHMVSGHVDEVGVIIKLEQIEQSWYLRINVPASLAHFIANKGSIAVDGVSLTVNEIVNNEISINLIPHTMEHTCFKYAKIGDLVNIEVDLMARQIARYMEKFYAK
jgi:riboflavin synthase